MFTEAKYESVLTCTMTCVQSYSMWYITMSAVCIWLHKLHDEISAVGLWVNYNYCY